MSLITPGQKVRPKTKLTDITEQQKASVNTFFSKLQVGDLCFATILEYALALFGQTKAGKTTLAHYLINNPLVGTNSNSYELRGGVRFLEALIGQTSVSQTEIPNQIQRKIQDKNLHILDCPGYSDSKGCQMVIANGYFHYRIFSKVQNLKFLIAIDYAYMGDVYQKPTRTLVEFLLSFKNYEDIKEQILNATSFVFTKLNKYGQSQEEINGNIEAKLVALRNCGSVKRTQFKNQIQQLIDKIINKKCYFYFERAKENAPAAQNTLLQQINKKTTFWTRSINKEDQQADLSHIKMTLGHRARDMAHQNIKFKRDFMVLTQLFQQRIKKAFLSQSHRQCSLSKITIQFLTNSILGTAQQKSFYEDYVLKFVEQFNIYITNEFNSKKEYQDKRKNIKDSVLSVPYQSIDRSQIENIQKLQICKMIIDMVQSYEKEAQIGKENKGRSVQQFKKVSKRILSALVQFKKIKFFSLLSKDKKNEKQGQYAQKISQFIYIIFRFLEEIRIFKIIFSLQVDEKPISLEQNENILENVNITQYVIDYITSLKLFDFQFISFGDKDIFQKCKLTYLAYHLKVSSDEAQHYYAQLQKYFCNNKLNIKGDNQLSQLQKASKLKIDRIKQQKLKTTKGKLNSNERIVTLIDYAENKLSFLQHGDYQSEQDNIQSYIDSINKLGDQLANFKIKGQQTKKQQQKAFDYAIKLFKSTTNAYRVIQTYKELAKTYDYRNRIQAHQLKDVLVQFAAYASTHGRTQLAIQIYQQAYSIIDWMFDKNQNDFRHLRKQLREEISQKIGMLGIDKRFSPSIPYYDALMKKKLFTTIEINILDSIKRDFTKIVSQKKI